MRRHSKPIILFTLALASLLLAPALPRAHAASTYVPGVKAGDIAVYGHTSATWNLSGPPQRPISDFINLNYTSVRVQQVTGSNVTASQTLVYTNNTSKARTLQGSVATDSGSIEFWFTAANLTAGSPLYTIPGSPTINQTFTQEFAGAPRTVNALNITRPYFGGTEAINAWWDQETGILLLISFNLYSPSGFAYLFGELVQTNIWSQGPGVGLFAIPGSLTVQQGTSSALTLDLISERGFSGNVGITYSTGNCFSGCPTVTVNPSGFFLSSLASANVTVSASTSTSTGSYTITFSALVGFSTANSTIVSVEVVAAPGTVVTTVLSNDPNSPDWTIDSPAWTLKNGVLDGNGLNGTLSPKIRSTTVFSSDRTVEVDFRTVAAGTQPWYTAWIVGKYANFYDKAVLILGTSKTVQLVVSLGSTINYYNANSTLSPDQWHHAKIVFTGNNARVYINGTLYLNITDPNIGALGNGPVSLASWGNSESQFNKATVTASIPPDESPTANFYYSPTPPIAGQTILFNGSPSNDPDGYVTTYQWNFGDGSTVFGEFPSHIYSNAGNYTVTLTVTDSSGLTASASQTVNVAQPIVHDVGVSFLYASPTTVISGQTVGLTAGLVNLGLQAETVNLTVYYGTKIAATLRGINLPITQYPNYVNLNWNTTGVAPSTYTMSATVFLPTDQNLSNNHVTDGNVTILPPPVIAASPSRGPAGTRVTLQGTGFPFASYSYPITVEITFDDQLVGFATVTNGTLTFVFDIPLAQPGLHQIKAYEQYAGPPIATTNFTVTSTPAPGTAGLTISVGTLYFPGDTVTVFLLSTLNGNATSASSIGLTLLLPDGSSRTLTLITVSQGVYRATYRLPSTATIGTYALKATAMINSGSASALGSFEVKLTWLQGNGRTVATVTTIAGAIGALGIVGFAWRKGYFTKRKEDFPIQ